MDAVKTQVGENKKSLGQRIGNFLKTGWLVLQYFFDRAIDMLAKDALIVRREVELFLGSALLLMGLFGFESSRYCDGNVNDHISCTRPATYYYFDTWDIVVLVLGVFFILFWYLKRTEHTAQARTKKN